MKRLIIACSLLLSSALFANEIPSKINDAEIQISSSGVDKNVDHLSTYFGAVPVGSVNFANYYVTNIGDQPLFFRQANIVGQGYYARTDCNRVLPPRGGRCSFTIEFRPWYEGYSNGQFMMTFDSSYTVIVDLAGLGVRY